MTTSARTAFPLRASCAAVQAALITLGAVSNARAGETLDPAVAALVQRTSRVEIGVGSTSADSYKANEYSGLTKKGPYVVGNVDIRGGGEYGSEDATRFRFIGNNLGTHAREIYGEYSLPEGVKITFGYDELRRNRSDSYQTPLLGAGTNNLSLPSTWIIPVVPRVSATAANARGLSSAVTSSSALVSGVLTAPTAAQALVASTLQAADLPAFQNVNLYTQRTKYDLGAVFPLGRQWEINASFRHEEKTGLKPMGSITRATGGDISTTIPDLIDQATNQVNLGLRYRADKLTVQAAYYGSIFSNNVPSMTWANWALPTSTQTMSTAPSNQFHQLNLTASYAFTSATRLVATGSVARSTQNASYLTESYTPIVPVNSLNGLVIGKTLNVKLTSRPLQALNLTGAYKYDDRNNRTAVNTYGFYDAGEAKSGTSVFAAYYPGLGSNSNLNANRPYSKRVNQWNLDADYRLSPEQSLKLAYEAQGIDRYCTGTWIDCADARHTDENTVRAEWRSTAWEAFSLRGGLAHSERTVSYNEDAWLALVPAANLSPTGAPAGSTVYSTMLQNGWTGYGPIQGLNPLPAVGSAAAFFFANNNAAANALYANQNRISELPGMRRFNMANRTRDKVRTSVEWQANDQLSVQGSIDYNRDNYANSVYGLQRAESPVFNLDASFLADESTKLNGFYSHEEQRSLSAGNTYTANSTALNVSGATNISGGCYGTIALRNANNKVDPCLNWTADMRDKVDTFGAAFAKKGLLGGKLDVNGSLSLSRARSTNDVTGGNYANNPLLLAVPAAPAVNPNLNSTAAYYISATPLPVVTTDTVEVKIAGRYALTKDSAVRVGYRYQHMTSTDWSLDGLQIGGLAGVLPTNETAPNYTVHTVSVSYQYSFR